MFATIKISIIVRVLCCDATFSSFNTVERYVLILCITASDFKRICYVFDFDKIRAHIFVKKNTLWKKLIENIIHSANVVITEYGLEKKFVWIIGRLFYLEMTCFYLLQLGFVGLGFGWTQWDEGSDECMERKIDVAHWTWVPNITLHLPVPMNSNVFIYQLSTDCFLIIRFYKTLAEQTLLLEQIFLLCIRLQLRC